MDSSKPMVLVYWIGFVVSVTTVVLGQQDAPLVVGGNEPSMMLVDREDAYTFDEFVARFQKSYADDREYNDRREVYQANIDTIVWHNKQKAARRQNDFGAGHYLGVNSFADLRADELYLGYNKAYKHHEELLSLYSSSEAALRKKSRRNEEGEAEEESLPFVVEPVAKLPAAVDWGDVETPVKSQGMCGSCWAFAATAVLESHVALQTKTLLQFSEQELVSCAPNPLHCGGLGGCLGSTAEIAFDFVKQHGMVQEWEFGYQSYHGNNHVNCTLKTASSLSSPKANDEVASPLRRRRRTNEALSEGIKKPYYREAVASIRDFVKLPSNNYTVLMNAVAKMGPIAVSVAATPWHLYAGGVFDVPFNVSNHRTTDINHLVVLSGYGTDAHTGEDYWLVRNSWSPLWGENGYIRLKRTDPGDTSAANDDNDDDCGMDVTPGNGVACTKNDNGKDIVPPASRVCGTSGILFDSSVPVGGHLLV